MRDYRAEDYSHIVVLWKETGIWGEERGDTQESIERCLSIGGRFLILEDVKNHKIIGTSWTTFDGRRMYLHHFCINPEYQRKGYGKALTEASLKFIKETMHQVKLEVHSDNLPAINLYEKYGFLKFKDYNIYMIRDVKNIPL